MVLPCTARVQLRWGPCGTGGSPWQRQPAFPQRGGRRTRLPGSANPISASAVLIRVSSRWWGVARVMAVLHPFGRRVDTLKRYCLKIAWGLSDEEELMARRPSVIGPPTTHRRPGARPVVAGFARRLDIAGIIDRAEPGGPRRGIQAGPD